MLRKTLFIDLFIVYYMALRDTLRMVTTPIEAHTRNSA